MGDLGTDGQLVQFLIVYAERRESWMPGSPFSKTRIHQIVLGARGVFLLILGNDVNQQDH